MAKSKVIEYVIKAYDKTKDALESAKIGLKVWGNTASTAGSKVAGAMARARTSFHDLGRAVKSGSISILKNLANIHHGIMLLKEGVSMAVGAMWKTIKSAFDFETLQTQFSVLMGSAEEAKKRIEDLTLMAAHTPFTLTELSKSSKQLHVFSSGVLGGTDSLKLIGDTAAATGANIEELSFWIGRAYSMISGGQAWGEAAMRLQELGVLTPQVRQEMTRLQEAGATNSEVWSLLEKRLAEFDGGMDKLSETGNGLMSTLSDNWDAVLTTFGKTFTDLAKNGIKAVSDALTELAENGTIQKWAEGLYKALSTVYHGFKSVKDGIMSVWDWAGKIDQRLGDWVEEKSGVKVAYSGRAVREREEQEALRQGSIKAEKERLKAIAEAEAEARRIKQQAFKEEKMREAQRVADAKKAEKERIRLAKEEAKQKEKIARENARKEAELERKIERERMERVKREADAQREADKITQIQREEFFIQEKRLEEDIGRRLEVAKRSALATGGISPLSNGEKVGDFVKGWISSKKGRGDEERARDKARDRMERLQAKYDRFASGIGGRMSKKQIDELVALEKFFGVGQNAKITRQQVDILTDQLKEQKKQNKLLEESLRLN